MSSKNAKNLVLLYIVEALISFWIVSLGYITMDNNIYAIVIAVLFSTEFFFFLFWENKCINCFMIAVLFLLAFMIRIAVIYYDINIRTIDPGDCHDFRVSAENFYMTNQLVFRGSKADFTILFMGLILKVFGPQRMVIQFFNTLFFMGASLITFSILKKYNINKNICLVCMGWMLFTPQNIKNTSISNREGFICFFVALSIYFGIKWMEGFGKKYALYMLIPLCLGTMMHSGVVGIALGYICWKAFYDKKKDAIKIKKSSIFVLGIAFLFVLILYTTLGSVLFEKFGNLQEMTDITKRAAAYSGEETGSTYVIPGGNSTSVMQMIFYSPLRLIYFLLSPMPWYWRGILDIIAFVICSVPHIIIIYCFILKIRKIDTSANKNIIIILFLMYLGTAFIFGWGVRNAGTAIRHRDKFLSLYTVLIAFLLNAEKVSNNISVKQ